MDSRPLLDKLRAGTLDRDSMEDSTSRLIIEFADWLAYPTELGKYPDEIEVIDRRAIYWPPARKVLPLALLRYRVRDDSGLEPDAIGVGLVGSTTFALFSCENHQRPVDDAYAVHCYWESSCAGLLLESERIPPEHAQWTLSLASIPVANPSPVLSIRFAKHALDYPGEEVLLVTGQHQGVDGWLVCDGPRTTWYPASEMPDDTQSEIVAMVHVGRVLLGFETAGVERQSAKVTTPPLDDEEFLASYERALSSARAASEDAQEEAFDVFAPIARHAERYVALMTAKGRTEDLRALLAELAPFWDHNTGYAELGKLAFAANLLDVAKQFIEKLRVSYPHHSRSETMGLLARIYASEGKLAEGVTLLRDCVARIKADSQCSPREVVAFCAPLLATLRDLERCH